MRSLVGAFGLLAIVTVACVVVQVASVERTEPHTIVADDGTVLYQWSEDSDGRMHGDCVERRVDGSLRVIQTFEHGEVVRRVSYDELGAVVSDVRESSGYLLPIVE